MNHHTERLAYDHEKFVNRRQEIKQVLDIVQRWLQKGRSDRRTVIFHGQRGTGKSWLLDEIAYRLADKENLLCLPFELNAYTDHPPQAAVRAIMQKVYQAVSPSHDAQPPPMTETDLSQLAEGLVSQVKQNGNALILFLDHVDESDKVLLETLEDHLLAPLIGEPKVLLFLAGRGRHHNWKRPELRLKFIEIDLQPFETQHTLAQLSKQVPEATANAEEIQALSGGYPWSSYILGRQLSDLVSALNECINLLLDEYTDLRSYFEALCVLRAFDEARMAPLFKAYRQDWAQKEWWFGECREMRQAMLNTGMVKWEENKSGYTIDQALRPMLESYLRLCNSERWLCLHQTALRLFTDWANKYERARERWQDEAQYHKERLSKSATFTGKQEEEKS